MDLSGIVKPLVFEDEDGDGVLTARSAGLLQRIVPQSNGNYMAPVLHLPECYATDAETLIERLNERHRRRILAAIDADAVAQLVQEAVERERGTLDAIADGLDELIAEAEETYQAEAEDADYTGERTDLADWCIYLSLPDAKMVAAAIRKGGAE